MYDLSSVVTNIVLKYVKYVTSDYMFYTQAFSYTSLMSICIHVSTILICYTVYMLLSLYYDQFEFSGIFVEFQ